MSTLEIHSLSYPFSGNFSVTFSFGALPDSDVLKEKYKAWGLVGHNGIDFGLPEGTEVLAVAGGNIIHAGNLNDFGIAIIIEHRWGTSLYAHLRDASVTMNQKIKRRQILGYSGKTGNVTGPHLHFGIKPKLFDRNNGYYGYLDPMKYLKK